MSFNSFTKEQNWIALIYFCKYFNLFIMLIETKIKLHNFIEDYFEFRYLH